MPSLPAAGPLPASGPAAPLDLDQINRQAWRSRGTVRIYERLAGWSDPGERVAMDYVKDRVAGQPILDIGVGAGRTTAMLREMGGDYIGIDYTQEMVDACRVRHPGVRIERMDARDLGAFADNSFGLAVFSFNGIDAVDLAGRQAILAEVHRVLRPGGLFLMSAHNRDGPGHGERPRLHCEFSWNPFKLAWRTLRLLRSLPLSVRNHRRLRALNESHAQWSIMNCGAHDFGIVVVYTTLAEQKRQLREAGFETELVVDNVAGRPVTANTDTHAAWWFHYVARKA